MDIPGRGQAAQSPIAKMLGSRVVSSVGSTTSWVARLTSSPSRSLKTGGSFDARCPHHQLRADKASVSELEPCRGHLDHFGAGTNLDSDLREKAVCRTGDPLWQPGQNAIRRFDQHNVYVTLGIDAVESVGDQFACRPLQLCGEFGAGCARADDRDVKLAGTDGPGWVWARMQASMRRRLKRAACAGVSRGTACSATPGVPKSLVRLPIAMTSVS